MACINHWSQTYIGCSMVDAGITAGFDKSSSDISKDSAWTEQGKRKRSLYYLTEYTELQLL